MSKAGQVLFGLLVPKEVALAQISRGRREAHFWSQECWDAHNTLCVPPPNPPAHRGGACPTPRALEGGSAQIEPPGALA